jgi:hypothetical protein
MRYLPELYYLQDHKDEEVDYRKALDVTVRFCADVSKYFYAELISPLESYSGPEIRKGMLPEGDAALTIYVQQLVTWLIDNSQSNEHFCLMLSDKEIARNDGVQHIFDRHDDTCCWNLLLTPQQFELLQTEWESHHLPRELFYPEDQSKMMEMSDSAPFKYKLAGKVGLQKVFTPLQWQFESNKDWYTNTAM